MWWFCQLDGIKNYLEDSHLGRLVSISLIMLIGVERLILIVGGTIP